jgi:hypothetical protein
VNKLISLSLVSIVALMVGCGGSSSSDVDTSGAAVSAAPKDVDLEKFQKAMADEAQGFAPGGPNKCTFVADNFSASVKLTLTDDNGKVVSFEVTEMDQVTHKVKPDGDSSTETYTIKDLGSVEFIHADDAFEQVTLTAKGGKTATCEIDF